jgi:hypothetical protein
VYVYVTSGKISLALGVLDRSFGYQRILEIVRAYDTQTKK